MASPRGVGSRTFTDMIGALAERCDLCSPNECLNFFKVARYLSGEKLDALLCLLDSERGNSSLPGSSLRSVTGDSQQSEHSHRCLLFAFGIKFALLASA